MTGILRVGLSLLLTFLVSATSFAVLATPTLGENLPAQPAAADVVADGPSQSPSERLNDPTVSSRYYVSVSDPGLVNDLLEARGMQAVKGKQFAGMPLIRVMDLDPKTLSELRGSPGIDWVLPYTTPETDQTALQEVPPPEQPAPLDYDVDQVQGATEAWSMGYTGDGVRIAVIDTGFDLGHPDLQGQQARYTSGPYAGWPIVYDDFSAIIWSVGSIGGWVANTTATSNDTGGFVTFENTNYSIANITDALGNHVTSASGVYHVGYHTDWNLINKLGYPVGVLVVDSATPGVYDTVYVDLLGDLDFGNDKPCTKGDEISYFDTFNATANTTQTASWSAGDGFADVSGGMAYWISDGTNVLPGSNWTYGATFAPASGDAVAFVGEFSPGASHGTMTASAALAAGRTMDGQLEGMAPGARLIAIPFTFNIYNSWMFAEFGADGVANTGDEANIVTNSYGWSDAAIDAGYEFLDQTAGAISLSGNRTLWCWATGNGGPGYGTTASVTDFSSVRVGAGTTMQYRAALGYESSANYSKWGDVAPFSNSGPSRIGKLGPEIIASGMYSLEPAPLNSPDFYGRTDDGSTHFQLGSGTSHAAPTVAGGAALGYQAYFESVGAWPTTFFAKAELMASADDMHFDPFKQGAGWMNATSFVTFMGRSDGTVSTTESAVDGSPAAALYPGRVYSGGPYESFPNFLLPGEQDSVLVTTANLNATAASSVTVSAQMLVRSGGALVNYTTTTNGNEYLDVTDRILPGTDLLKVTVFIPLSVFDPDLDYVTNVVYTLALDDWVDLNHDGVMNVTTDESELFRYSADIADCNYHQVMIRDSLERTHDGLIVVLETADGRAGVNFSIQIDCYELQPFPWVDFQKVGDTLWSSSLALAVPAASNAPWHARVSVPVEAPIGTYEAAVYIDSGDRVQCMPIVIIVPATSYEFEFGGQSLFDTPYNNDFTGLANKHWRYDTGDWRMFWSLPTTAAPSTQAYLMTSVGWSELPTTVNVYVLAAQEATFTRPPLTSSPLELPWGPGWDMTLISTVNDRYVSDGIFEVGTNTGGPKEVVAAPVGQWMAASVLGPVPFAILARCPVMSGNSSHDTLQGSTTWVTLDGYTPASVDLSIPLPGPVPLRGGLNGTYNLTSATPVEVRGGGTSDLEKVWSYFESVHQDALSGDALNDLANADYTRRVDVVAVATLRVSVAEIFGCPDLDLGLWLDTNRNGIADLSEPHWYSGNPGSNEEILLQSPASGIYLVKVLGYNVTADPGYFYLQIAQSVDGEIRATGFESPASSGEHNFTIFYDIAPSPGTYQGKATFGFLGADDMFSIPVRIAVIDKPAIRNLTPADGSVMASSTLHASFRFLDEIGTSLGLNPSSIRVFLDGIVNLGAWCIVMGSNVTLTYSFGLAQGWHSLTVSASDVDGNRADTVSNLFYVNSAIETFTYSMLDPRDNASIENGDAVSLTNVTISGTTDPDANVTVAAPSGTYSTTANSLGGYRIDAIQLVEGLNILTITTVNDAGVSATGLLAVVSDTYCDLVVDRYEAETSADHENLTGTLEPGSVLTINGVSVPISDQGTWSWTAALIGGVNVIEVSASDPAGNWANETLYITCDRTPPELEVLSPANGAQTSDQVVVVSGTVDSNASVTVNGIDVEVFSGTWSASVALVNGTNIITVIATDGAGNSVERTLVVAYDPTYITPDELRNILDQLNNTLNQAIKDADDFASLVMFIALILFLMSVLFTGGVWYLMSKRMKEAAKAEEEESLEEIEEEPRDVEREFEDLEKEIRREDGQ